MPDAGHRDEVLGAGQDEGVQVRVVAGDALVGLAAHPGYRQGPAQPERAVGVAGAVGQRQRGLQAVAAGGQLEGDGEVAGPGVQVGLEGFPDAGDRAAALGEADQVGSCSGRSRVPPLVCVASWSGRPGGCLPGPADDQQTVAEEPLLEQRVGAWRRRTASSRRRGWCRSSGFHPRGAAPGGCDPSGVGDGSARGRTDG